MFCFRRSESVMPQFFQKHNSEWLCLCWCQIAIPLPVLTWKEGTKRPAEAKTDNKAFCSLVSLPLHSVPLPNLLIFCLQSLSLCFQSYAVNMFFTFIHKWGESRGRIENWHFVCIHKSPSFGQTWNSPVCASWTCHILFFGNSMMIIVASV